MSAETDVLFDAPGPKALVRHRIIAVLGVLLLLTLLFFVIKGLANPANDQLTADKWSPFIQWSTWQNYLIPGLIGTLTAAAISVVLAIIAGILLGLGRLSDLTAVRAVCGVFVEFFRAIPVLMMMFFAYFFGIFVLKIPGDVLPLFAAVVGLTFYNSCVIAELVRSGVHSLPRGQREAGYAIGLTSNQTLTAVLLPQAITSMLPSIVSQLVVILKDSALAYAVTYLELLRQGTNLAVYRGNLIPTLIVLAVIYIIINWALTRLARALEGRMRHGKRGIRPGPTDVGPDPALAVQEEDEKQAAASSDR
ncbi:MAG: amino acid ABC transporter permease [Microlunatus sp.]|nr:amino acid ABC transporter permease [Microlunatus sp.]MDN5770507.1 amino acid ABC transporter permease [Microlunatus sp.]MDN5803167.1 amino acid ABC transporter permease [Microlunatus sp.]